MASGQEGYFRAVESRSIPGKVSFEDNFNRKRYRSLDEVKKIVASRRPRAAAPPRPTSKPPNRKPQPPKRKPPVPSILAKCEKCGSVKNLIQWNESKCDECINKPSVNVSLNMDTGAFSRFKKGLERDQTKASTKIQSFFRGIQVRTAPGQEAERKIRKKLEGKICTKGTLADREKCCKDIFKKGEECNQFCHIQRLGAGGSVCMADLDRLKSYLEWEKNNVPHLDEKKKQFNRELLKKVVAEIESRKTARSAGDYLPTRKSKGEAGSALGELASRIRGTRKSSGKSLIKGLLSTEDTSGQMITSGVASFKQRWSTGGSGSGVMKGFFDGIGSLGTELGKFIKWVMELDLTPKSDKELKVERLNMEKEQLTREHEYRMKKLEGAISLRNAELAKKQEHEALLAQRESDLKLHKLKQEIDHDIEEKKSNAALKRQQKSYKQTIREEQYKQKLRKEKEEREERNKDAIAEQRSKLRLAAAAEQDYLASTKQEGIPNIERMAKMRTAARTAWEYFMTTADYQKFLYETWKVNWGGVPPTEEEMGLIRSLKRYDPVGYRAVQQRTPPAQQGGKRRRNTRRHKRR